MGCDLPHPVESCRACAIEKVLGLVDSRVAELFKIVVVVINDVQKEPLDVEGDAGVGVVIVD